MLRIYLSFISHGMLQKATYLPSSRGSDRPSSESISVLVDPTITTARSSSFSVGGGPLISLGSLASSISSSGTISAMGSLKSATLSEDVPIGNRFLPDPSMYVEASLLASTKILKNCV